jgi:Effector-associated domain 1
VTRELIERIAEAFDAQELEQLVREDMGESIRNLMAWNEPLHTIVFKLLEKTKRRELTTDLLRCILNQRPRADALREAIRKNWPDALQQPTAKNEDARQVANFLGVLQNHLDDNPAVRSVVADSRDRLEQLRKDIDVLFNYKKLHDCLHEIQVSLYPQIDADVK